MKLIICIPGKSVSTEFLYRWTNISYALAQNHAIVLRTAYSPNIYYSRMACIDISPKSPTPLQGFEYDKILWIDTDIILSIEAINAVLASDNPIVAGMYFSGTMYQDGSRQVCTVKEMDETYCDENGSYQFITDKTIPAMKWDTDKTTEVAFTGMGLMAVKRGVFEALGCEAFKPLNIRATFAADDVSFCLRAKKAGFETRVHMDAFVNHEKLTLV